MTTDSQVRPARPGEGAIAAELLRQAFPPSTRNLTIWGSPQLHRYLEYLLELGPPQSGYGIYLLAHTGIVVGAIANRFLSPVVHPTVMYLNSSLRGSGVGTLLLAESVIDFVRRFPCQEIVWDVFAGSERLETWYHRLGGVELERRTWWLLDPGDLPEDLPPLPCTGVDAADQHHASFGFSSLNVEWNGTLIPVGRLPGPWFRVFNADSLRDPRFLTTLRHLDPRRGILHIGSDIAPGGLWRPQLVVRRLTFQRDQLLREFSVRLDALRDSPAGAESL